MSARRVAFRSAVFVISPWKRENNYRNACIIQSREYYRHVVSQRVGAIPADLQTALRHRLPPLRDTDTTNSVPERKASRSSQPITKQQGIVHRDDPSAAQRRDLRLAMIRARPLKEVHKLNALVSAP